MERVVPLWLCVAALMACKDSVVARLDTTATVDTTGTPTDTGPPPPIHTLKVGDTLRLQFPLSPVPIIELDLAAGDTVDVGMFIIGPIAQPGDFDGPNNIRSMSLSRADSLPAILGSPTLGGDTVSTVYARVPVTVSGHYRFRPMASRIYCYSIFLGGCSNPPGTVTVRVRKSGPVLTANYSKSFSAVWNRSYSGATVGIVDTFWVRNSGAGTISLNLAAETPWLGFTPATATLAAGANQTPVELRVLALPPFGETADTLRLTSADIDVWSSSTFLKYRAKVVR